MTRNRRIARVVARLWPVTHRRFEEMCTLAVTGQLGGTQMCELNDHVAACDSCRKYLESIAEVSLQAMPLRMDKHARMGSVAPPEGMRDRFLARMTAEGSDSKPRASQHPSPVLIRRLVSLPLDQHPSESAHKEKTSTAPPVSFPQLWWRWGTALAGCAVIGLAGYYIGQREPGHAPAQPPQLSRFNSPVPQESVSAGEQDRVRELQQQKSELAGELAGLKDTLSKTSSDDVSLHDQLTAAKEKLARLTAQVEDSSQRSAASPEQSDEVSALEVQVENLSQRLAESELKLEVQKQTSGELSAKLEAATSDLQRERDLKSAKSEMGDLVAARNLHIVDVYDADATGNRQRPFGRVFYIEGKSLVFYAYDLDDNRLHKADVVFHVWGGKAGAKETTHSLGILNKDGNGDSRWAMTFDDPGVLAQINSVFVTAEPANRQSDEPHGKKVLYAYFGSAPNHP